MTAHHAKIAAAGLLLLLGGMLLRCTLFTSGPAMCMRTGLFDMGVWLLYWGALGYGIWLGLEAGRWSQRRWVGWVVGLLVFALLTAGLFWADIPLPAGEIDDGGDNSYRR